jgi:probable non-F420 flavinoid oxidoreductase
MTIAYHASHEQFAPSHLLHLVQRAEQVGFDAIHSSDHFHPWSKRQGQSGFTFSWIGAAMQATKLPFSMVCAPGQRYHPAIVAQAIATLGEMFPGRFGIELGSGEAINEMITGKPWPDKKARNKRLVESATIINQLLSGKEVFHQGCVQVIDAKLYTLPSIKPLLFCVAISEDTCAWAGQWAEGLITTAGDIEDTHKKINVFRESGGEGHDVYLQFSFSYDHSREQAIAGAYDQWRTNLLPTQCLADFSRIEQFDQAADAITIKEVEEKVKIITSMKELKQQIDPYYETGASRIVLHNVNTTQEQFIDDFKCFKR